jgi:hypothetical protein
MTLNITNTLVASISATSDSDSTTAINRGTGNPAFDSNAAELVQYCIVPLSGITLQLPATVVTQVYIRNIDPGSAAINVNATPHTGSGALICTLYTGEQFIVWSKPAGALSGFTGITLSSTVGTILCEYFLGG